MRRRAILRLTFLALVALPFIGVAGCHSRRASDSRAGEFTSAPAAEQKGAAPPSRPNCSLPQPEGFVGDFANIIDEEARGELGRKLERLKRNGKIDFVVVTTKTTGGRPIFDYSLALAQCWGVGASNPDKAGMLLLLAADEREWRIQISRKLEQVLSNEELSEWGGLMKAPFQAGRYGEGLIKYVDAIIKALEKRRGFSIGEA